MKLLEIQKPEICFSIHEFDEEEGLLFYISGPAFAASIQLKYEDLKKINKWLENHIWNHYCDNEYYTDYDA